MHGYTADKAHRKETIAVLAILASLLGSVLREKAGLHITVSSMSVFGFLFWVYDSYIWKWKIFGLRLSFIENWNGTYEGTGKSSQGAVFHMKVTIVQSWSSLVVRSEFGQSKSYSTLAAWFASSERHPGIRYEYSNEDKALSDEHLVPHRGMSEMELTDDAQIITGSYYTDPSRGTEGVYKLTKSKANEVR